MVEWGARVDEVHPVEWVLHDELDLATLSQSRVYHGLGEWKGTMAVTSLKSPNDFESVLMLLATVLSSIARILTVVFSVLPCGSEVNPRVSPLSSLHAASFALRDQSNNPRLSSSSS